MKQDLVFKRVCKRPDLSIKCYDQKDCICKTKKNKHFKKFKPYKDKFKRKSRTCYLHKKKFRGSPKSNRCFIYNKKGHYAKNCPNKQKSVQLIQFLAMKTRFDLDEDKVESIFSLDDEPTSETIITLKL